MLPKFKMRSEGQRVAMGDTLAFRSMKAGLYLHVSAAAFDGNAGTRREVCCCARSIRACDAAYQCAGAAAGVRHVAAR